MIEEEGKQKKQRKHTGQDIGASSHEVSFWLKENTHQQITWNTREGWRHQGQMGMEQIKAAGEPESI